MKNSPIVQNEKATFKPLNLFASRGRQPIAKKPKGNFTLFVRRLHATRVESRKLESLTHNRRIERTSAVSHQKNGSPKQFELRSGPT
jgi:hypothetical protein